MILPIGRNSFGGFTLVELLLVLVLMSVVAAMSITSMPHGPRQALRQFARQMIMDFRLAQTNAIEDGGPVRVTFDAGQGQYAVEATVPNQKNIKIRDYLKDMRVETSSEVIVFYPDGSALPAGIKLFLGDAAASVNNGLYRFGWTMEEIDAVTDAPL